jgi:Domain of unknown function (DUF1707)
MNDGARTSYADRDAVIERLRVAAGDGRLDPDELDARIEAATAAKTFGQLARLTTDLPAPAPLPRGRAPWMGGVLSALVPGLGSAVNGFWRNALVIFGAWFAIMLVGGSLNANNPWVNVLVPLWFAVYVIGIVDGVRSVQRRNRRATS